ncbi:hypothetical protein T4E_3715, partial [Trichinella pseudospiralis]
LTYSEAITMLRKLQRYLFQEHSDLASTLLKMESKLEKTEAKKRMKRSHKSSSYVMERWVGYMEMY